MPNACFSYSAGLPLGAGNRNAAQQAPHDSKLCFSYCPVGLPHDSRLCFSYYPGDMPLGVRNRDAAQQAPHDSKICFSYH